MTHDLRSRLRIPTFLAVSALGTAPGCGDDGTEDTGNDGPSTMSASATADGSGTESTTGGGTGSTTGDAGSTGPAVTTTTAADSTGAMTGTDSGTDTGALPDCQAHPEANACEATENCVFIAELGGCIVDCAIIEDEATCIAELGCEWYGKSCDFEPIA